VVIILCYHLAIRVTQHELLKPSSSRAQLEQRKVLDSEVIIRPPRPSWRGYSPRANGLGWSRVVLGYVHRWLESPRVGGRPDRCPKRLGAEVIQGGAPALPLMSVGLRLSMAPSLKFVLEYVSLVAQVNSRTQES
jgi:hypothetical protein